MNKKFMWTLVLAVGLLAVSCGGNIKKVQNGVFSDFDNTITVGKAIENNSTLKGGKWDTVKLNGRDYVRYTVRMTGEQVWELLSESIPSNNRNKPHYWAANEFKVYKITSMSDEEKKQVGDIFKAELDAYRKRPNSNDFLRVPDIVIIDSGKINDDFKDPYLLTIEGKVIRDDGYVFDSDRINKDIYGIVTGVIIYHGEFVTSPSLEYTYYGDYLIDIKGYFDRVFGDTNYADNTDLLNALIRTRTKLYDLCVKANAEYKNAVAEYEERWKTTDIEPLLTIDRYEIVLSFVMNQDGTFATNMMETYTDITLNCFDNLKVRYNIADTNNAQTILTYIYRGMGRLYFF